LSGLVAKCGIDCGSCPWGPYPRKGMTAEEFGRFRNSAKRILGYMPIKTPCLTCQVPDAKIPKGSKLPNRKCLIRQCVDGAKVANCAYCSRFPCDTLKATSGLWNRENIEKRLGAPISEEEYHAFVEPFEGIGRLQTVRASLEREEILEPAKVSLSERKIVDFPENLPFSKEETASFKAVHQLLETVNGSSLGMRDTDTFAQRHRLENRRAHFLRFLWILGRYGKFEKEADGWLAVDAGTYMANRGSEKMLAVWSFVRDTVFKVWSKLGVDCERHALDGVKDEDLATGTGYLRSKGWVMKMGFEEKIGGTVALEALQSYTRRLDDKYGKKAFERFSEADMRILLEK
jgi:Protein of unknown function (DUF3795)